MKLRKKHDQKRFKFQLFVIQKSKKKIPVGIRADTNNFKGEMPSLKCFPKMTYPAGFGAFAMTVSPPPVTTPLITAYLKAAGLEGIKDVR